MPSKFRHHLKALPSRLSGGASSPSTTADTTSALLEQKVNIPENPEEESISKSPSTPEKETKAVSKPSHTFEFDELPSVVFGRLRSIITDNWSDFEAQYAILSLSCVSRSFRADLKQYPPSIPRLNHFTAGIFDSFPPIEENVDEQVPYDHESNSNRFELTEETSEESVYKESLLAEWGIKLIPIPDPNNPGKWLSQKTYFPEAKNELAERDEGHPTLRQFKQEVHYLSEYLSKRPHLSCQGLLSIQDNHTLRRLTRMTSVHPRTQALLGSPFAKLTSLHIGSGFFDPQVDYFHRDTLPTRCSWIRDLLKAEWSQLDLITYTMPSEENTESSNYQGQKMLGESIAHSGSQCTFKVLYSSANLLKLALQALPNANSEQMKSVVLAPATQQPSQNPTSKEAFDHLKEQLREGLGDWGVMQSEVERGCSVILKNTVAEYCKEFKVNEFDLSLALARELYKSLDGKTTHTIKFEMSDGKQIAKTNSLKVVDR